MLELVAVVAVAEDTDPVSVDDKGAVVLVANGEGRVDVLGPRLLVCRFIFRVADTKTCR